MRDSSKLQSTNVAVQAEVSFFHGFSDGQPKTVKVSELVEETRAGKWAGHINPLRQLKQTDPEAYSKEKLSLPFFLMAGTFSERKKTGFLKPSGYIILDIDGLPVDQLSEIRARIESDQHTAICFLSPSGVGLKVAFKVSISNDAECKAAFATISEYFNSKYQIELDSSGKDISRACFVSFDPDIYYNPDAVEFQYSVAAREPEPPAKIQAAVILAEQLKADRRAADLEELDKPFNTVTDAERSGDESNFAYALMELEALVIEYSPAAEKAAA